MKSNRAGEHDKDSQSMLGKLKSPMMFMSWYFSLRIGSM